jgi:hypothetical protein
VPRHPDHDPWLLVHKHFFLSIIHTFDSTRPIMTVLADLTAALDGLCAADPAALAGGETVRALHRQLARLEAATTRAVAAFDAATGGATVPDRR